MLFISFTFSGFSQENRVIDSLKTQLKDNLDIDTKVRILDDLVWSFRNISIDSSIFYAEKAFPLLDNVKDKALISQFYSDIGGINTIKGDYSSAKTYYKKSLTLRTFLKDTIGVAKVNANLSTLYIDINKKDSAMIYSLNAIKIFEQKGLIHYTNLFKSNLIELYNDLFMLDKAILTGKELITFYEKENDLVKLNRVYTNLGKSFFFKKDTINEIKYYSKALEISRKTGNIKDLGISLANLAITQFNAGNRKEAFDLLEESLKYRLQLNSNLESASIQYVLATEYFKIKKIKKAKKYFYDCLPFYKKGNVKTKLESIYYHLSLISAIESNIDKMLVYKDKNESITKSVLLEDSNTNIIELEKKYQTEKKEKELLKIKAEKATTELNLTKQKQVSFALVGGLVIILLIGFSLFQRNKRKHQLAISKEKENNLKSIITAEEKERTRIARELHDGIVQQIGVLIINSRNNLSKLGLAEKPESKELLSQLENTGKEIRNISHQMMPRALEEKGLITALQELLNNSLEPLDIHFDFEYSNISERLSKNIEVTLYRITQELINNIIKHSKASQVNVQLIKTENSIVFMVEDNGTGFSSTQKTGLGLRNIKSRIDIIKGSVNFNSETTGTLTTIKIPL
jgi:signal transduction histidine kinase